MARRSRRITRRALFAIRYRRLRQETVEKGEARFQDTWFEAAVNGKKLTGVLRYLPRSSQAFFVVAVGLAEVWEREQASALAVLDTFTLLPPESP